MPSTGNEATSRAAEQPGNVNRVSAAVVAHDAVSRAAQRAANTGDGRAMRVLDMGRGKAPGRKDQQPVPGVAHARARREQVDDLVLAEDIFFEALCDRQDAARAAKI